MELIYLTIIRNAVFIVGMNGFKLMQVKVRMGEFIFKGWVNVYRYISEDVRTERAR